MNALLVLTWLALCVLLFLICRVPFNRWTATAATLGGILLTAGPIIAMNHYHPYSSMVRPQLSILPITAPVAGAVIEVAVEENQTVRRGELLFRVDPEPLQLEVRAFEARVEQAQSALQLAPAGAARDLAQARLAELQAGLSKALYRLGQTSVRAPADGRIADLGIASEQVLGATPTDPAMRLVGTDPTRVVAWLRQNQLTRIDPGAPAEIAFDTIPGRIFSAEVVYVSPTPAASADSAQAAVQLRITDPGFDPLAPIGTAQVAIYGTGLPEIALLRKLLLRMSAWIDYVYPYA